MHPALFVVLALVVFAFVGNVPRRRAAKEAAREAAAQLVRSLTETRRIVTALRQSAREADARIRDLEREQGRLRFEAAEHRRHADAAERALARLNERWMERQIEEAASRPRYDAEPTFAPVRYGFDHRMAEVLTLSAGFDEGPLARRRGTPLPADTIRRELAAVLRDQIVARASEVLAVDAEEDRVHGGRRYVAHIRVLTGTTLEEPFRALRAR